MTCAPKSSRVAAISTLSSTTIAVVIERPAGMQIALCFVGAIVVSSLVSRTLRSTELRFMGFQYVDDRSRFLWDSMRHIEFPVLVPHRPGRRGLAEKEQRIREGHRLGPDIPVVFMEIERGDPSEFYQTPLLEVIEEHGRFILRVTRCVSIAHAIAAVALELSRVGQPPEIHFGWSDESPLAATAGFVLFGEGNVPWMVRELIRRAEPAEVEWAEGDVLVLYTDGLTETRNADGEMFTAERAAAVLAAHAAADALPLVRSLREAVEAWGSPTDDLTIVVCKRTATPPASTA